MLYWVLKSITDCEYVVIGEDSSLQKALDIVWPALEHAAQVDPLMASAKKQGQENAGTACSGSVITPACRTPLDDCLFASIAIGSTRN